MSYPGLVAMLVNTFEGVQDLLLATSRSGPDEASPPGMILHAAGQFPSTCGPCVCFQIVHKGSLRASSAMLSMSRLP